MKTIKIYRNGENFEVDAKELFDTIASNEDYYIWLSRITNEDFTEERYSHKRKNVHISAEAAKTIAMESMTEAGCEIALYIGQQLRSANVSKDNAQDREICDLKAEIERLKSEIDENKDKIAFYDAVRRAEGSVSVQELAVLLSQNGFHVGEHKLFSLLRDDGFLCKKPLNCPSKKSLDQGLMIYYSSLYPTEDKNGFAVGYSPRLTHRGEQFFLKHYLEKARLYNGNKEGYEVCQ